MDGSLTFACAANALGGGKVRSSRAKVSRAVAYFAPVAILRPPLEGARPAMVERFEMSLVVIRQHEEPAETIQIAVVRVARGPRHVRLGGELGDQPACRGGGLLGEAGDPGPGHRGGPRAGLAGRTGKGALREAQSDQEPAALDDQEVGRHLTEPPVVVGARG